MPKLRDYFLFDLNNTFINNDEFAVEMDIDGRLVEVVYDSDELKELKMSNNGEGLANSELLFHIAKSELDFEPFTGQDLMINHELMYVNDVKEDEGMYTIAMGVAKA